jgi:hypothetical protein
LTAASVKLHLLIEDTPDSRKRTVFPIDGSDATVNGRNCGLTDVQGKTPDAKRSMVHR